MERLLESAKSAKVECNCELGVKMCHKKPCYGTPEEFRKIIEEGYWHKLRIDLVAGFGSKKARDQYREIMEEHPLLFLLGKMTGLNPLRQLIHSRMELFKSFWDVEILSGGTKNDVNHYSTDQSLCGSCLLLTNNLCSVHHIKPTQGAIACCKNKEHHELEENTPWFHMWNTPEGREVVKLFKLKINQTNHHEKSHQKNQVPTT